MNSPVCNTLRKHKSARSMEIWQLSLGTVLLIALGLVYSMSAQQAVQQGGQGTQLMFNTSRSFPKLSNGYLIAFDRQATSATQASIIVGDSGGKTALEYQLEWPDDGHHVIADAAVIASEQIVVVEAATDPSSQIGSYALVDNVVTHAVTHIDLGSYRPTHVCTQPDGAIWILGQDDQAEAAERDYTLIREYDLEGNLRKTFFQRRNVEVPGKLQFALRGPRIFINCTSNTVAAFIAPAKEWFQIDTRADKSHLWYVRPMLDHRITGMALTESGDVYATIWHQSAKNTITKELFKLSFHRDSSTASWEQSNLASDDDGENAPVATLLGETSGRLVYIAGGQRDGVSGQQPHIASLAEAK